MDRALAELVSTARNSNSAIALERLIEEFLRSCENSGLAIRTITGYREIARNHVLPTLGKRRIEFLSGRDLDNLYGSILEQGLSTARARHAHVLISRALGQAVKWGWLERNVGKLASPSTVRRAPTFAPSPEELGQILTVASKRSPQLAAVFALAALTGARRGEALALKWSDFDRVAKVLTISKSVGYTSGSGIFIKSTKTHGVRRIGVDEAIESVIVSQIEALQKNVEAGFELIADPYLFFGEPDGSVPLHPDIPSKFFRIICDSLELPYHLHQLRHFTATQLKMSNVRFDASCSMVRDESPPGKTVVSSSIGVCPACAKALVGMDIRHL